jgi:hypothetical protein
MVRQEREDGNHDRPYPTYGPRVAGSSLLT